jgi:hypothetical protein
VSETCTQRLHRGIGGGTHAQGDRRNGDAEQAMVEMRRLMLQLKLDGQRRQDAYPTTAAGTVCLSRLRLRSVLLCKDGASVSLRATVEEECPALDRKDPRSDRTKGSVAGCRDDGEAAQSHVDRLGELLQPRADPQGVSGFAAMIASIADSDESESQNPFKLVEAGDSRALPKFESYGMPETAAFRGWKAQDAIEWFHGIGRLVYYGAEDSYGPKPRNSRRSYTVLIVIIARRQSGFSRKFTCPAPYSAPVKIFGNVKHKKAQAAKTACARPRPRGRLGSCQGRERLRPSRFLPLL